MHSFVFDAIGTRWQIDIETSLPAHKKIFIEKQIAKRIGEFDKTYSRFRDDSFVKKMSLKKGSYILPPDASPLLSLYHELYKLTDGYFTPLIGRVLVEAGYDEKYSLTPVEMHHPSSWDEALRYDFPKLTLKQPSLLDFGGAGKGYLVDIISTILKQHNVSSYCVDAGGDICHYDNSKILRVGLENPENFEQVIGVAIIGNESICGSAGNRRRWGNYHHIINPFTLSSPQTIVATWVIAETTMLADALSTCLFFVSPEILLNKYQYEYIILYKDFSIKKSEGFKGELFSKTD